MSLPEGGVVEYSWGDATPNTVTPVVAGQAHADHKYGWHGRFGIHTIVKDAAGVVVAEDHDTYDYPHPPKPVVPPVPYQLDSITPNTGPAAGGTGIVLAGLGFQGTARVRVAGVDVVFTIVSDTQIDTTTPPGRPGSVAPVQMWRGDTDGANCHLLNGFFYT